jgi:hypothetical protein
VPALPSTAEVATNGLPASTDDAVTGAFNAALDVPHSAAWMPATGMTSAVNRANAVTALRLLTVGRPRRT